MRAPLLLVPLLALACSSGSSGSSGGSGTGKAAAAPAGTTMTPSQVRAGISGLLGKRLKGEAVMYAYEDAKLNGTVHHNAYIADDAKKTGSMKCTLAADPKIPQGSKVAFEGKVMSVDWIDECKLTKK